MLDRSPDRSHHVVVFQRRGEEAGTFVRTVEKDPRRRRGRLRPDAGHRPVLPRSPDSTSAAARTTTRAAAEFR